MGSAALRATLHAPILSAINPDLSAFRRRGGKLIQYHGWNDPLISPYNSIDYYESVLQFMAAGRSRSEALADVRNFYRLFMEPGVRHCGGGPGPGASVLAFLNALEQWREAGIAPASIPATHVSQGREDRSRPLCPYPGVARYKGSGDATEAVNYACRES